MPNPQARQHDAELDAALERIDTLLAVAIPDTPEHAELQTLSNLAAAYEKYPLSQRGANPGRLDPGQLGRLR